MVFVSPSAKLSQTNFQNLCHYKCSYIYLGLLSLYWIFFVVFHFITSNIYLTAFLSIPSSWAFRPTARALFFCRIGS